MHTVHTVAALRAQVREWRRTGARIGFVPTMGNLHAGHLRLVARARQAADRVVASVFVNPLQFGPHEDFSRYPRTLAADQKALAGAGCDLLFAPDVAEMYPNGQAGLVRVIVPGVSETLEGACRPGHFEGVATVVSLLFHQVQPDLACFGEKDYQQLAVIRKLVADQQFPIEIIGVPTERAEDGLALSSRNQYLSPEERRKAPMLYATLQWLAERWRAGESAAELEQEAVRRLTEAGFVPDYVALRAPDLGPLTPEARHGVALAAARLGDTRLIDNLQLAR